VDSSPLPEISYNDYDADDQCDDLSDLGGAEGKPPVSLKQTKFSLKQFAKMMGQANYSAFNKWKKVWEAGFLEKKHRSITLRQNRLKQLIDGPLLWEMAVADCLETYESCVPLDDFDNAKLVRRQWVEIFLKKRASDIWEARKTGWRGTKRLLTDLGECAGKMARSNLPELPNSTFMVVIRRVSNGDDIVESSNQLQAAYTDVRHYEELIDFINTNGGPKGP